MIEIEVRPLKPPEPASDQVNLHNFALGDFVEIPKPDFRNLENDKLGAHEPKFKLLGVTNLPRGVRFNKYTGAIMGVPRVPFQGSTYSISVKNMWGMAQVGYGEVQCVGDSVLRFVGQASLHGSIRGTSVLLVDSRFY